MSEEKTENYYHIGLCKTGTTFLQKNVFPKIKDINFISSYSHERDKRCNITLYSYEKLTGSPMWHDWYATYDLLQRIPTDSNIILVLRDKKKWVRSNYVHYIKSGGYLSFKK